MTLRAKCAWVNLAVRFKFNILWSVSRREKRARKRGFNMMSSEAHWGWREPSGRQGCGYYCCYCWPYWEIPGSALWAVIVQPGGGCWQHPVQLFDALVLRLPSACGIVYLTFSSALGEALLQLTLTCNFKVLLNY